MKMTKRSWRREQFVLLVAMGHAVSAASSETSALSSHIALETSSDHAVVEQLLGCSPLPEPVQHLLAVRSGDDVHLQWDPGPNAAAYNIWRVVNGDKQLVPVATEAASDFEPAITGLCEGTTALACDDPGAIPPAPELIYYQVRGTCADGTEGPASCSGIDTLWVSSDRAGIPDASFPLGTCSLPGTILPISVQALALDDTGNPVAACAVIFFVDFSAMASCGRAFGEFCDGRVVAVTDADGVATVNYTMLQADLDFCNCLPSSCDPFLCRSTCAPECSVNEDLFCQVAISAAGGNALSGNFAWMEYGR